MTLVCLLGVVLIQFTPVRCPAAGQVIAWGSDDSGQCTVPSAFANAVAIAAGESHSLALMSDGRVGAWGFNFYGQATVPVGLSNIKAIAAGATYSLGLRSNGTVVCWGSHTPVPASLSNVTAIAAGYDHSLALKNDGTVVAWGSETTVPVTVSNAVAIAAGTGQSLALLRNGRVIAWGDDSFFKTQVPHNLTNAVAIAAGQDHCLALTDDGHVVGWGANYALQLAMPPDLSNVVAIAAGAFHNVALKSDGTVAAWGDNSYNQIIVNPLQDGFCAISAGGAHNLALVSGGMPEILIPPTSQHVLAGQEGVFRVMAVGRMPLSYTWQHEGTNLVAATCATLLLTNVQPPDAGSYQVEVANLLGAVQSPPAMLTVSTAPPVVVRHPLDQIVACGDDAILEAQCDGSRPLFYQWYWNAAPLVFGTNQMLVVSNVQPSHAGGYFVVISNVSGWATSRTAALAVSNAPPQITSGLSTSCVQGYSFSYAIQATHRPTRFTATGLPLGLTINSTSGVISGTPQEYGSFAPTIGAGNGCAWGFTNLMLSINRCVPWMWSLRLTCMEGDVISESLFDWLNYWNDCYATWYGADNLPPGLTLDPRSGLLSGSPVLPGEFVTTLYVGNSWGTNSSSLLSVISPGPIAGLSIDNITTNYSSPYLLDFQFTLRDDDDPAYGMPIIVNPKLLSATCLEDGEPVIPSESGVFIDSVSAKVLRAILVLDFTASIASLTNGDANRDGISDAVDFLVSGAQAFVNQQASNSLIGAYEFHREDRVPQQVVGLTTDKTAVNQAIAGIWTNFVAGFPAGSRCWDAVKSAIAALGSANPDEEHMIVCVSDGRDVSSTATLDQIIGLAVTNKIKVFCVGFGAELDPFPLVELAGRTGGIYLEASSAAELGMEFAIVSKEFKGRYLLRWATLRRSGSFQPGFLISYQGHTASSPLGSIYMDTNAPPIIDTNTVPPTTNYPYVTNFALPAYKPTEHAGDATVGLLRLVAEAEITPPAITLRAVYLPRYVRQLRLHYVPNWPCTATRQSSQSGQLLYGWSMIETNDGAGGRWLLLSSPNPSSPTNSLPFCALGDLVRFTLRDLQAPSNAFSQISVDNTIYTNTGGQSFMFSGTNLASFLWPYPVLPHGTPLPWLLAHGFTGNFAAAELSDDDNDGVPAWLEFAANTDPLDQSSALVVKHLNRLYNDRFQITFTTALNRSYGLQFSTNLVNWQTVVSSIAGTGADVTVTDTSTHPAIKQIFYRIAVY